MSENIIPLKGRQFPKATDTLHKNEPLLSSKTNNRLGPQELKTKENLPERKLKRELEPDQKPTHDHDKKLKPNAKLYDQPEKKQEKQKIDEELKNRFSLDGYEKISKIGEGTYGVVYKAREHSTRKLVALKKVKLSQAEGVSTTTIREVALLKEMKHENIVELTDMIQKDTAIYLVFDFYELDLRRYMDNVGRKGLTMNHIRSFMYQLLNGLHYCHSHRILHRDLKPQNLLINRAGKLIIADLGLCRTFSVPMRTYTHQVITLWYRAPEILLGSQHYSTAVDMWSVGCIMAEMISFAPLFPGSSQIDELFRIFRKLGTPNEEVWPGVSALPDYNENFPPWKPVELRDVLESFPDHIVSTDSAYALLKTMLTYDPVYRVSAKKAKDHQFFFDDTSILKF